MSSLPGSPLKAVAYGVLVDVGGSIAAGIVLVIVYSILLAASGASAEEIQAQLGDPSRSSGLVIAGFAIGLGASFLGGYVCARLAGAAEMKWVGVVAAASGVVSLLMGTASYPLEWNALLALVGMAAVFAGGWTGAKRNGIHAD